MSWHADDALSVSDASWKGEWFMPWAPAKVAGRGYAAKYCTPANNVLLPAHLPPEVCATPQALDDDVEEAVVLARLIAQAGGGHITGRGRCSC